MSKKTLLLALAAVSAAMFALPAAASAAWDVDPAGVSFTGTSTGTSTLKATNEPTITCEGPDHVTGSYDANSQTTGTITLDFTQCHTSIFGFTIACTTGSSGNTIASGGTFHNVTTVALTQIEVTFNTTTIKCGSTTPIVVTGTATGVISEPACFTPSTVGTIQFSEAGGQSSETEGSGNKVATTFTLHALLTFREAMTKTCN